MGITISDRFGTPLISLGAPLPLPELMTVTCLSCMGDGYLETADLYEMTRCTDCDGTGQLEVCSGCKTVPAFDTDECACTPHSKPVGTCESCERNSAETDGLCKTCWLSGLEAYREDAPPEVIAAEIEYAREAGWL